MLLRHLLNDYFCDVAESDGAQMSVEEFKDHPRLVSGRLLNISHLLAIFDFQLIDVQYVKGKLLKLNPRKAVGCDNISQRLLRITVPAHSKLAYGLEVQQCYPHSQEVGRDRQGQLSASVIIDCFVQSF